MTYLADLITFVQGSDTAKVCGVLLGLGFVYLAVRQIHDKVTAGFVRKEDLSKAFEVFKKELMTDLVTSKDLIVFRLEQAAALEASMKDTRHVIAGSLQATSLAATESVDALKKEVFELKVILARIDEHMKMHPAKAA